MSKIKCADERIFTNKKSQFWQHRQQQANARTCVYLGFFTNTNIDDNNDGNDYDYE